MGKRGEKMSKIQRSAIDMKKSMEFQCNLVIEQVGEQNVWNSIDNWWGKKYGIPTSAMAGGGHSIFSGIAHYLLITVPPTFFVSRVGLY